MAMNLLCGLDRYWGFK